MNNENSPIQLRYLKFCPTCQIIKPLRSKHDSISNKCIAKFDHYCGWGYSSVGQENHRQFVLFLSFFLILLCIFNIRMLSHFLMVYQPTKSNNYIYFKIFLNLYEQNPSLLLWYIIWTILNIFVLNQLVHQAKGIFNNLTINEFINKNKYQHFWNHHLFINPFNLGYTNNFKQFWGISNHINWYDTFTTQHLSKQDTDQDNVIYI
ncbi:palmitoyltransferase [Anaeramoeba flamelloides]|uniref:Palmitoyltransferase n=1 Tax=Anaeramoeba flamelloides TaxID=1746091 RepID=A0ABQ8XUQ2_9EUKA|nr:palmitoyltransferase [Anaeramoeba flamelloides]